MHDPAVHSHTYISSFRHTKICFSCTDTPKEAEKGGLASSVQHEEMGCSLLCLWWVVGGWLLPTVAIVKVGGMCGGSRLNSDIKDIFNNSLDDSFFSGSHRIAICPEQGIFVMFLSVVFILFTPTQPNPPPTGTFPLRVLSARYRSVLLLFFRSIIPMASLLAAQKGLEPGEIFFGRQNVSATWTRSGLSLIRALKHPHHSASSLFRPPPPARVGN